MKSSLVLFLLSAIFCAVTSAVSEPALSVLSTNGRVQLQSLFPKQIVTVATLGKKTLLQVSSAGEFVLQRAYGTFPRQRQQRLQLRPIEKAGLVLVVLPPQKYAGNVQLVLKGVNKSGSNVTQRISFRIMQKASSSESRRYRLGIAHTAGNSGLVTHLNDQLVVSQDPGSNNLGSLSITGGKKASLKIILWNQEGKPVFSKSSRRRSLQISLQIRRNALPVGEYRMQAALVTTGVPSRLLSQKFVSLSVRYPVINPTPSIGTPTSRITPTPTKSPAVAKEVTIIVDPKLLPKKGKKVVASLSAAALAARAGDIIEVPPGVYRESVIIKNSGTASQPIIFRSSVRHAAIIDAAGKPFALVADGAEHITLDGFVFRNAKSPRPQAANAMVRTWNYWNVLRSVIEYADGAGLGIRGKNVVADDLLIQYNGQLGIGASATVDCIVKNSTIRGNNRGLSTNIFPDLKNESGTPLMIKVGNLWYFKTEWEAGGTKISRSRNFTFDSVLSEKNNGLGLWYDTDNYGMKVVNSILQGNKAVQPNRPYQGSGLMYEFNGQPDGSYGLVSNNIFRDNQGDGLVIAETRNVVVEGNTFESDFLELRSMQSRPDQTTKNISVIENLFIGNSGIKTSLGAWTLQSAVERRITSLNNTFIGQSVYFWAGKKLSSLQDIVKIIGLERGSRLSPS